MTEIAILAGREQRFRLQLRANGFHRRAAETRAKMGIAALRIVPGTTTDIGAAIIYSLLFTALLLVDAGRSSVDRLIARKMPAWRRISG